MNKRQREAAERAMLKHLLDTNPKIKEIVDNLLKNPNPELKDILESQIISMMEKARMQGVHAGWYAFAIRSADAVKDMTSVEEVKEYFKNEATKAQEKLGINIDKNKAPTT